MNEWMKKRAKVHWPQADDTAISKVLEKLPKEREVITNVMINLVQHGRLTNDVEKIK